MDSLSLIPDAIWIIPVALSYIMTGLCMAMVMYKLEEMPTAVCFILTLIAALVWPLIILASWPKDDVQSDT